MARSTAGGREKPAPLYRVWVDTSPLVTGEAVAVEVPVASVPMRALSGAIDVVVLVLLGWGGLTLVGRLSGLDEAAGSALVLLTFVTAVVIIPTVTESLTHGLTLGKTVCGLRTVRDDLGPIGVRHALTRHLVGIVDVWLTAGIVAVVTSILSPRSKRMGDIAAGTFVVRDRMRLGPIPTFEIPTALEPWVSRADLRVPPGLLVALRSHLTRGADLTPQAREAMAATLYAETLRYVAPAPPADAPAAYVFSAVLAEHRRREARRLARDRAVRERLSGRREHQPH